MNALPDDGVVRCSWADGSALYRRYHDLEWGRPVHDSGALFERISLEAFQAGLSWLVILGKRENLRRAFADFDVETVARYTDADVTRLLGDAGIVRNRAKIEATITNARAVLALQSEDLGELLWSFAPPPRSRPADGSAIQASTPESTAMSRELKRRGFRFVGPTTAYALMQATGMVDDHVVACWVPPVAGSKH